MASSEERIGLLKKFLEKRPVSSELDYNLVAEKTADLSEEELKVLCDKAAEIPWKESLAGGAGRPIETSDFIYAISGEPQDTFDGDVICKSLMSKKGALSPREREFLVAYCGNALKGQAASLTVIEELLRESVNVEVRENIASTFGGMGESSPELLEELSEYAQPAVRVAAARAVRQALEKTERSEVAEKLKPVLEKLRQDEDEAVRKAAEKKKSSLE